MLVGQTVGEQGDDHARGDAADAEHGPERDQPEHRPVAGDRVDHPAEQDRLRELDDADRHVGHAEADDHPALGPEQGQRAAVAAEQGER
jgi:hypothetical protein